MRVCNSALGDGDLLGWSRWFAAPTLLPRGKQHKQEETEDE
jgi:hypothetical protein